MTVRLLFALYVLGINTAVAQKGRSYPVRAGQIPSQVLPDQAMYALPEFTEGKALLRNGTSTTNLFNYNFLLDEMHFINDGKDTLAIADPALIKAIVIKSTVFYYDKGYVREVFKAGEYKLAVKQEMMQVSDKTWGAYDAASGASSIKTYGTINNYGQKYQLMVKKDVLFQELFSYYIGNEFNTFLKANKKNFHILFPGKDISTFVKEHKTDFNYEEDLRVLLHFCAE